VRRAALRVRLAVHRIARARRRIWREAPTTDSRRILVGARNFTTPFGKVSQRKVDPTFMPTAPPE
jgi:hypothetical protein